MRYRLHLTAIDVMDQIVVTAGLHDDEYAPGTEYYDVLERAHTLRGVGEGDPKKWARAALLAMLEEL